VSGAIDPQGFEHRLAQYFEWMRATHYAEATVRTREKLLPVFVGWCAERGITQPAQVTRELLERYQRHLYGLRKESGEPLCPRYQGSHLVAIKMLFRWLLESNHALYDPSAKVRLPRWPRRLPRHVLTKEEAERVINQPDVSTSLGLRDRALLETLYSTGVRKQELAALKLYDLDAAAGTLMVRRGKGGKQRVVPIGERALLWVQKYLADARPEFSARSAEADEGWLFLSSGGAGLSIHSIVPIVRKHLEAAGIDKKGSVHLWRHTMATLMLEGGADVRYVQEMLGHASLESTQIYTQVAIKKLKEVHAAAHPASAKASAGRPARLKSPKRREAIQKARAEGEG